MNIAARPLGSGVGFEARKPTSRTQRSTFDALGFRETVAQLQEEVRALYTTDQLPWIIGYSATHPSAIKGPLGRGVLPVYPEPQNLGYAKLREPRRAATLQARATPWADMSYPFRVTG